MSCSGLLRFLRLPILLCWEHVILPDPTPSNTKQGVSKYEGGGALHSTPKCDATIMEKVTSALSLRFFVPILCGLGCTDQLKMSWLRTDLTGSPGQEAMKEYAKHKAVPKEIRTFMSQTPVLKASNALTKLS